ncbi:aldo/keto reductase [Clostridia bacterium]|nr:aldo/keto reductase [Clostridia bacterium]
MNISPMTLGTVQLGMAYGIANSTGKPSLETAFDVLDTAHRGGVTCLDTARLYGDSERVIGQYLAAHPGSSFTVITKFRVDPAAVHGHASVFDQVSEQIESSVKASLSALGLTKLPLLLLHNADDMDAYGSAVPDALRSLMDRGLVERVGVSVYEGEQVARMLQNDLYSAVQLPINVLDRRLISSGMLEALRLAGKMVFARSVFLQGLFFMAELPARFTQATPWVKRLKDIAEREGMPVSQLALTAIRDLPGITSLVLGAETPEQAARNAELMNAPPLPSKLADEVAALGKDAPIEAIMAEIRRG